MPVELVNGRVSFGWGTSTPRQRLAVVRAGPLAQIRYGAAIAVVSMLGRWSTVDRSALLVIGLAQIARGVYAVRSTRHADGREIRRMLAELERDRAKQAPEAPADPRASSTVARHLSRPGVGGSRTRWLVLTALNAGIPIGAQPYFARSVYGACAPPTERIADTFAKWALRGTTPDHAGYDIPSPSSLEDWGAPLAALARESS